MTLEKRLIQCRNIKLLMDFRESGGRVTFVPEMFNECVFHAWKRVFVCGLEALVLSLQSVLAPGKVRRSRGIQT